MLGATVTTGIPTDFFFLDNSHLRVILIKAATSVPYVLAINTSYTVAGAGVESGGTVTLTGATVGGITPVQNDIITITRNLPFVQAVDYVPNAAFPASVQERALDELTMAAQQVKAQADTALRFEEGENRGTVENPDAVANSTILTLAGRKGKLLGFHLTTGAAEYTDKAAFTTSVSDAAAAASLAAVQPSLTTAANSATAAGNSATAASNSATSAANSATSAANQLASTTQNAQTATAQAEIATTKAADAASSATLAASFQAQITFATMAEASAASVSAISTGEVAFIRAFSQDGDKGHGVFRLDKASTATLVAGMVIAAAGGGRWIRLYEGEINLCWMGARDGVNISPILQSVIDANQSGCTIYIPANGYYMSSTVFITGQAQRIRGDGANQGGTTIYWNGANDEWMFENNFTDNTIEHICLTGNSKLSNGIRNRGNPYPTTKTHKRAKYDRLWIRAFGTGMSFERAANSGLTQCDSTGLYALKITDCNIGLLINSGDADYISVFNCEINSNTTAGVRLSWGGSLQLRNIVFATNYIDVDSPIGGNGMESLVMESCQGEAQTSGIMLNLRSTIQQVSLRDNIFNGTVKIGCGGTVVSNNNSYDGAASNLELVADNQQIYQFFDRFGQGAAFIDNSPTLNTTSRIYARAGSGFRLESFPFYVRPVNGSQRVIEAQAATGQSADMLRLNGNAGNPFRVDSLNRLVIGGYTPPTVTVGANAGTGATVARGGFDNSGLIEVTTGTSPSIGVLANISFTAFASAPRFMFAPANALACGLPAFASTTTVSSCAVSCATAPIASSLYKWHYWAVSTS